MISTRLALLILILFIAHTTHEFFEVRQFRRESRVMADSIRKLTDGLNQLADASIKNSNASMRIMDLIGVKK